MDGGTARRRTGVRFAATTLGLVVVGLAGYGGFVAFVGADRTVASGVMVLAAGTGFAAFFSPCSFPLLLTFLTRRSNESARAAVVSAMRVAAGSAMLLTIAAIAIALGGTALGAAVEFNSSSGRLLRFGVGLVLVLLGLRQANLWRVRMRWLDRIAGGAARLFDPGQVVSPGRGDVMYGFGYLLTGFG